ncbi:MAG: ribosome-associated translation inhibitor RaiA [Micrococcales bacterium]|nr:ribosome-associated translation inhibitor RaiA [Micrococcales bacterium]MCL2666408.1 ribosome-associated translation inhibitor RaiA [Micrococcales bacterium]
MEIVVTGRHWDVSAKFRDHVESKVVKIEQLAPRAQRVDVLVSREANPRQAETSDRVELTVVDKGPVVRAEASASDPYAALDLALDKLLERLRRARDRRKDHRGNAARRLPIEPSTLLPVNQVDKPPADEEPVVLGEVTEVSLGDSPVVIREKVYPARPMTIDDALYEMELVGHPFFLFIDSESNLPAVVYSRRGWTYGVIKLDSTVTATV